MSANLAQVTVLGLLGNILSVPQYNQIGSIQIDTTLEEVYEDVLEITEHPVERGANITDHSFKRPMELMLRCGWSDSSVSGILGITQGAISAVSPTAAGILGVAAAAASLFGGSNPGAGASGSFSGGAIAASDYVAGIYSQLLQMQESRQPVSVASGLRVYDNMLLQSIRVHRDQRTQYVLDVQAVLKEVILVSTQASSLPAQSSQANPASTADTVNAGAQQLQTASPSGGGSYPVQ